HAGVNAHGDDVAGAVVQVVGQVVAEAGIAALVAAEAVAVDPDDAVAEHAIELDGDAAAEVRLGDLEGAAIPADAVLGMIGTDGAKTVLAEFLVPLGIERQFDRPVVREVDGAPVAVIERGAGGAAVFTRLHQRSGAGIAEVAIDIGGVAEGETPGAVKGQSLSHSRSGRACARSQNYHAESHCTNSSSDLTYRADAETIHGDGGDRCLGSGGGGGADATVRCR